MSDHVISIVAAAQDQKARQSAGLWQWMKAHYALSLFYAVFLVPTLLATVYFGFVASDCYVSETRFVVRSASKPAAEGAAAYLQDIGINRANDDAYAVQDYILSRDAMRAIAAKANLRAIWRPANADIISRYGPGPLGQDNDETLYRHYLSRVKVDKNLETGITTVRVAAYKAEDAHALAQMIVQLSEAKVNAMNARARADGLAAARRDADAAALQLAKANAALTRYRNEAGLVSPEKSAEAGVSQKGTLETERARIAADLSGMVARTPGNPAIPALRRRLEALDREVAAQGAQLTGGRNALAGKVGGYEQQLVERELAGKLYETALKQLDTAVDEANHQQIFLEQITDPNLPDTPIEPRRIRYIFTVALLSFWAFLSFYLLLSGGREHLNIS